MAYRTTSWKNTDIGKIPSDWFFALFKDTFTKYPANSCSRDEMNNFSGVYQNIHYGDILIKYGSILDYNKYQIPFLNVDIFKKSKLLQNGDIVIADTAEDETVGKCVELLNLPQDAKILSGMHTIFCRPNNKFAPRFLGYLMNSSIYHDQLVQYITGTKVSAISKTDIDKTYILIPRIEEQQKIAAVLTDLDDLIAELENVRDKKQAIKFGAMQELLTGKRRLPGFNKPWKEVELGELLTYEQPQNYIVRSEEYRKTGTPVLTAGKTFVLGYTDEIDNIFSSVPVIIFDDFTTVSKFVNFPFKVKSSAIKILKLKNIEDNLKFIFEVMQITPFNLLNHQRYWISKYSKMSIKVPEYIEQTAIANVLSDMDNEISAINDKINKYKQIKAGVADELLSGRIRLIKPQE